MPILHGFFRRVEFLLSFKNTQTLFFLAISKNRGFTAKLVPTMLCWSCEFTDSFFRLAGRHVSVY
jgi:hypothetical protein